MATNSYKFDLIEQAQPTPGVYAWYFKPTFTKRDIELFLADLSKNQLLVESQDLTANWFNKNFFKPFKNKSLDALVKGKLTEVYQGTLDHKTENTIDYQNVATEKHLLHLKSFFDNLDHSFLNPIYIGKAENLKNRLTKHKKLILKALENSKTQVEFALQNSTEANTDEDADAHYLAEDIIKRQLDINKLFVVTYDLPQDQIHMLYTFEFILNRINYPICGRN